MIQLHKLVFLENLSVNLRHPIKYHGNMLVVADIILGAFIFLLTNIVYKTTTIINAHTILSRNIAMLLASVIFQITNPRIDSTVKQYMYHK